MTVEPRRRRIVHRWVDHTYFRVNSRSALCPCGRVKRWWQVWR